MAYIDAFLIAVPLKNKTAYIEHAKYTAKLFKEFGAISVVENWSDDLPETNDYSFKQAVKCEQDEVVCFSWITWPDKVAKLKGRNKILKDPRMSNDQLTIPFDGKRMIFGGFEIILEF